MYIIENITQVVEKSSTIHLDGNEVKKNKEEIKQWLDEESYKILMKNGAVVFDGKLIRKV